MCCPLQVVSLGQVLGLWVGSLKIIVDNEWTAYHSWMIHHMTLGMLRLDRGRCLGHASDFPRENGTDQSHARVQ
jgi:hypothetical protein